MMINFKCTLIELGKELLEELYKKIDAKWKWVLTTEIHIREFKLAQVMPNLGKKHMTIELKDYANKFVLKRSEYKNLRNKIEEVVQESKIVWKKLFGLMSIDEKKEDKEEKDVAEVEVDNYKEDIYDDINKLLLATV